MALSASLVYNAPSRQRYLVTQDGAGGTTVNLSANGDGIAFGMQDIRTNAALCGRGLINRLANADALGYGQLAAGVGTQAKARALWCSDFSGANPGSPLISPTAIARITPRSGAAFTWTVDGAAVITGGTSSGLLVTGPATASTAYLDILTPGTIGD